MAEEFRRRRELLIDGLAALPGDTRASARRRVLRLPGRRPRPGLSGADARGAAAHGRRRERPRRHGVRRRGAREHPHLVRELPGEPHRALERIATLLASLPAGASVSAPTRPPVLVTRVIPDAGLRIVREAADVDLWEDPLPPPREVLLERVRGTVGLLVAADRPGGRRAARRGRTAAARRVQPRGRLRQHRRRGLHAPRGRGRQHAGRPDRDDRRPRLRPDHGGRPSHPRSARLRSRGSLADVGPAAAARQGRPRRDARDRGLRAHRPGGRAAGPRVRDAGPLPRRGLAPTRRSNGSWPRRGCRWTSSSRRATSSASTSA